MNKILTNHRVSNSVCINIDFSVRYLCGVFSILKNKDFIEAEGTFIVLGTQKVYSKI